ncbi:hypothetical protein HHI36_019889 [Cryptolaemus montrouzieri]|uniref:PiggyBac transposable element-derived protein domain-containing protein n=1 Tax=Cryptolaemus montrouzieri TaxID=559131 RepID=A0ABD2N8X9_9CUCU
MADDLKYTGGYDFKNSPTNLNSRKISKISRRQRFSASNNYLGLEESINSTEEDSDDGFEYNLAIIPPEPSVVTDEEEGFDDENLPTNFPNDVPGNIEVFIRDEGALSDSSDDEPLASKRARIKSSLPLAAGDHSTNSTSTSTNPVCRKCNPIYTKTYMESDTRLLNESCMKKAVEDLTPVQIFQKFFGDEELGMIGGFSNLYASQNNLHNFSVKTEELKVFFGILYYPVIIYWSIDEDI